MRKRNRQDAFTQKDDSVYMPRPLQCLQPTPCRTLSKFLWEFEAVQEGNAMVLHSVSQPEAWTFLRVVLCLPCLNMERLIDVAGRMTTCMTFLRRHSLMRSSQCSALSNWTTSLHVESTSRHNIKHQMRAPHLPLMPPKLTAAMAQELRIRRLWQLSEVHYVSR